MCGLVGIVGPTPEFRQRKVFRDMLFMDTIRGIDSTGITLVNSDSETFTFKNEGLPQYLFKGIEDSVDKKLINTKNIIPMAENLHLMMGHNRAATLGAVNTENAHPYDFPELVGAHNGTLRDGYFDFDSWFKHWQVTDSFCLYDEMNHRMSGETTQEGREEAIKSVIKDVEGALALTFYDKLTKKFYLYRNNERPLKWIICQAGYLMYASEDWMMYGSAFSNRTLNPSTFKKSSYVYDVKINTLFTLDPFATDVKDIVEKETNGVVSGTNVVSYSYGYPYNATRIPTVGRRSNNKDKDKEKSDQFVFDDVPLYMQEYNEKKKKWILSDIHSSSICVSVWDPGFTPNDAPNKETLYALSKEAELGQAIDSKWFFRAKIIEQISPKKDEDGRPMFYATSRDIKAIPWEKYGTQDYEQEGTPFGKFVELINNPPLIEDHSDKEKTKEPVECAYCLGTVDFSERYVCIPTDKSVICHHCIENDFELLSQVIPPHLLRQ